MSRNRKLEKLGQLEKLDYAHDLQDANLESDVRNIKDKMNGHLLTNQRPSWSTSLKFYRKLISWNNKSMTSKKVKIMK